MDRSPRKSRPPPEKPETGMTMSAIQNVLSRAGLRAIGEAKLAFLAAPRMIRPAAVVLAWSAAAILLGMIVGLAAVILPPTGAFGIVAVVALVLLWVMPDLPAIPDRIVRRLFFIVLVVDLCVPNYYAIDLPGLPWISARRIVTFPLILLFAIAYAGSSETRRRIATILRSSRFIAICVFGYLGMTIVSIFTSIHPPGSLSQVTDLFLESYVPFLAILYVVRKEDDVYTLIRILCWCAVVITLAGAADFRLQSHVYLDLLPKFLVEKLAEANPALRRHAPSHVSKRNVSRQFCFRSVFVIRGVRGALSLRSRFTWQFIGESWRDRLLGFVLVAVVSGRHLLLGLPRSIPGLWNRDGGFRCRLGYPYPAAPAAASRGGHCRPDGDDGLRLRDRPRCVLEESA